jgi:putative transcription factor
MEDLYCDICGKTPVRAQILVEGAKLLACARCMRSGKILHTFDEEGGAPAAAAAYAPAGESDEILEDYARIIHGARERAGLPLSVVAERIKEKESYLHAIEGGRLVPTIEVARKLEKELGIKLVEKSAPSIAASGAAGTRSFTPPTLGDMVVPKKKKEK